MCGRTTIKFIDYKVVVNLVVQVRVVVTVQNLTMNIHNLKRVEMKTHFYRLQEPNKPEKSKINNT
jgi:hypothetical protein